MNFIRTELTLVDFLLDRTVADVHILINEQLSAIRHQMREEV